MCEEGLVKDPKSRAERDSEERKREHVRGHRKEVRKKTENYTGRPVRVEGESSEDFAQFRHKTAEALPHLVLDSKGTRVRIGGISARGDGGGGGAAKKWLPGLELAKPADHPAS